MPGAGKQEFPENYGEDTLTKPGKAPMLPGIPGIPIYLQDAGIIQVLPEQLLGSEQSKRFPGGEKKIWDELGITEKGNGNQEEKLKSLVVAGNAQEHRDHPESIWMQKIHLECQEMQG